MGSAQSRWVLKFGPIVPRKLGANGSFLTRRWRKGDSNSRSHPMRYVRKRLTPLSFAPVGDPGPGLRIDFPPSVSPANPSHDGVAELSRARLPLSTA